MRYMRITKNLQIFALALAILLGLPAQRVSAAVIRVDEACNLHDAITAANRDEAVGGCPAGAGAGHDIITIGEDITLEAALPVIESVIAIEGGGHTISGDEKFRIFDVDGGSLTIRRLTLAEGHLEGRQDAEGGAIRLGDDARVYVVNSTFADNTARTGGAIATTSWNNYLDVSDSRFVGNDSELGGGAIQMDGGTVNISRSSFSDNYTRGHGGGIDALRGRLRVSNSTFNANRAYDGGGINVDGAEATLTHLTLAENRSRLGGDGLFRRSGMVYLRNSIIDSRENRDYDCIGKLEQNRGNLIADWSCRAPLGGKSLLADFEGGLGYRPLGDGSPALDAADPEFCLDTDQIGTARPQGGGCDMGAIESTTATSSTVSVETKCSLYIQIVAANEDRWVGPCPAGNGADTIELIEDITLTEPLPRITSEITIEGNGHTINGGDRFQIFNVHKGNLTIQNMTIANGNAKGRAGGAVSLGYKSVLKVSHVAFINNVGRRGGAIVSDSHSQLQVANSSFHRNSAGRNGGALDIGGQAEISRSVFRGNSAAHDGGAIYSSWKLEIDNSTLLQNTAELGGALWVATATLTHVTIANNVAREAGGLAMFSGVTLRNGIVADNSGGDCAYKSDSAQKYESTASLIGDGSCDAALNGNAMLGALVDEDGSLPLLPGSPAIDSADPAFCPPTDQLGNPRPAGAGCDLGAVEYMGESR